MSAPLLFGLNLSASAAPGDDPIAVAVRAEELGFDFVSTSDHPCGATPTHETWTMLCFVAAATTRLRIATRVLGVPYRQPAMVAKMAESFDRLSQGRLILGLGGGSADEEHRAFGLGVRSPREKVDGLEDTVAIVRGLWTEETFSYRGHIYRTENARIEPKPQHSIPIWLGTYGPRALTLTGRLADGWIPSLGYASLAQLVAMRERVIAAAEEAGRDPVDVSCVLNAEVRIDDGAPGTESLIAGSADAVAARLRFFLEAGFGGVNFMLGDASSEQAERVATEVIPLLR